MNTKNKNIAKGILYFALIIGFIISPAFAQSGVNKNSDKTVKILVEYKLVKDNQLDNENINVIVKNKTVTLTGNVQSISERNEAGKDAASACHDYTIANNLKISDSNIPSEKIVKNVLERIHNNAFYGIFDWVNARDTDGVVTLTGWVHVPWYKEWFQKEAEKVAGVKEIKNEIQSTFGPGSIGYRAARLIYSDPMYEGMQYMSNPPIHIIVNNGSIILEGKVYSDSESGWLETLLRFNTDAFDVNNNLVIRS
ncbi:MAG: BON domain-containing protein [Bacteroidetes bacterium]|nr:BON domain-containing protein [Bacteroidota bacterium]